MDEHDEIIDFIRQYSFAVLISTNGGRMNATHIPVLFEKDDNTLGGLYCHIAKANPQWQNMDEEVLVIFPGPHSYISSSWYETDQAVPTWNYLAVHVYGKINIINDREEKIKIVTGLTEFFEGSKSEYSIKDLKENYFEGLLNGIVAFKIDITKLEGKKKLSQNHSKERKLRVIEKLGEQKDVNAKVISELMKKNL